jgi:hypothetical protein
MLKPPGGLIRATAVNKDGKLHDVHISSDFSFYPADDLPVLEKCLNGVSADAESVTETVEQFYARQSVESPGVQPEDFARVLIPASA